MNSSLFNLLTESTYHQLELRLKSKGVYNEDIFHDTFIEVYDSTKNGRITNRTAVMSRLFSELYRENIKRHNYSSMKHILYEAEILEFIVSANADRQEEELAGEDKINYADAYRKVKKILSIHPKKEASLFLLYYSKGVSIEKMSAYAGVKPAVLYGKLKAIKQEIINQVKLQSS